MRKYPSAPYPACSLPPISKDFETTLMQQLSTGQPLPGSFFSRLLCFSRYMH